MECENAQVAERQLLQPVELSASWPTGVRVPPCAFIFVVRPLGCICWLKPAPQPTRRKFFSGGIPDSKSGGGRFDPCTARLIFLTTRPTGEAGSCNLPESWFDSSRRLCDRSSIGRAPGCDPGRCGFESHRSPLPKLASAEADPTRPTPLRRRLSRRRFPVSDTNQIAPLAPPDWCDA